MGKIKNELKRIYRYKMISLGIGDIINVNNFIKC